MNGNKIMSLKLESEKCIKNWVFWKKG